MKPLNFFQRGEWISRIVPFAISLTTFTTGVLLIEPVAWAGGTVTSPTEASLRAAMIGGGAVTFTCDGTITLGNTITVTEETELDGSGQRVTISGGNAMRVFYVNTNVTFTVINLTIAYGWSTNGAGVFNDGGTLNLLNSTVISNSAVARPGINGTDGIPTFPVGSPGNPGGKGGDGLGGAVFNFGTARFVNTTFAWNTGYGGAGGAGGAGGSPHNAPPGEPTEGGDGGNGGNGGVGVGGICSSGGSVFLTNCTLAFNTGIPGTGGAGGLPAGGTWRNGHPGTPGANGAATGALQIGTHCLANTLLAANPPVNSSVTLNDAGHNLSSDGSCAFIGVGSMNNTDPKLGPLADNGGPTLTMALLPVSPAINAGASAGAPTTDQRGITRPQGPGVDIGAFEYQYVPVFTGAKFQTASEFWLQMSGLLPAQAFKLQASTNLLDWSDLTNFVAGANGTFEFVDCNQGNYKARFYRLKVGTP